MQVATHIHVIINLAISFLVCFSVLCLQPVHAEQPGHAAQTVHSPSTTRIITLAPHLTELVYLLQQDSHIVAVSDYSDYPADAARHPSVSSYTGVDFAAILTLKPTHVIAWEGGNKAQDIAKLHSLGLNVLSIPIHNLDDIGGALITLGQFLDQGHTNNDPNQPKQLGQSLAQAYVTQLHALRQQYRQRPQQSVFYYSWPTPLMSIGKGAWANNALGVCHLRHIFADSPVAYPQVALAQVLREQPNWLINVSKEPFEDIAQFWQPHRSVLAAPIVQLNPDLLHRFTPRILQEIKKMCTLTEAATPHSL